MNEKNFNNIFFKKLKKTYIIAIIGTISNYYNNSLYGFLAPVLITVFLPTLNPINAFIIIYGLYPVSVIAAPLGAITFGKIGDKWGRKISLRFSIIGMACTTLCIGIMPEYTMIGLFAPFLFTILRFLQSFFVAGEYNGGAIYMLEHTAPSYSTLVSGLYCSCTVLGILIASIICSIIVYSNHNLWRFSYIIGFFIGLIGVFFQKQAEETPEFKKNKHQKNSQQSLLKLILENLYSFLSLIGVSTTFSGLYSFVVIFITNFLPIIIEVNTITSMIINIFSLISYWAGLILSGWIASIIGIIKLMKITAIIILITNIFLFTFLYNKNLFCIFLFKVFVTFLIAFYVGPFHAWAQSLYKPCCRYRLISLGYCIGSKIGSIITPIAFFIWKKTENLYGFAILIIFINIIGFFSLSLKNSK